MKINSPLECGYKPNGQSLFKKGENTFDYRSLSNVDRDFVDEMVKAGVFAIIEPHEGAQVIPFPRPTPAPAASTPRMRMRTRKKKTASHG